MDFFNLIMERLTIQEVGMDFVRAMKKEMSESMKDKEIMYNFNFSKEESREGRFQWEVVLTENQ
jgi:hypothetical protein